MKTSPTGKPLCSLCRKLATHRMPYGSTSNGVRTTQYLYHCSDHTGSLDESMPVRMENHMTTTLADLLKRKEQQPRPRVVCLCGSTRFMRSFQDANLRETLAGKIVLTMGCDTKSDDDLVKAGVALNKEALDTLHLAKIDLADEILVLNVGGHIGESTRREIEYARLEGVIIRYLEPFEDA
jgi:hypothetical protein